MTAEQVLALVDARLRDAVLAVFQRRGAVERLSRATTIALVGHRAAGKSTMLAAVASRLGLPAVDLDLELGRREPIREWFRRDHASFRAAEREAFLALPPGVVVAVGGGFLSHHGEALRGCLPVLVPVSFETFCERLRADVERPRLRPELSVEDELRAVWAEREVAHAQVATISLAELLMRAERGWRPRRVVTLPPGGSVETFSMRARAAGADLLEVRTDLTFGDVSGSVLPVLVAERGQKASSGGVLLDGEGGWLRSMHAEVPLRPEAAVALWGDVPAGVLIKHVEPLGELGDAGRLFETQARLITRFGANRVTVLATGVLALPFRAVLAQRNALDYCALDETWAAAPGQRLVADAAREYSGCTQNGAPSPVHPERSGDAVDAKSKDGPADAHRPRVAQPGMTSAAAQRSTPFDFGRTRPTYAQGERRKGSSEQSPVPVVAGRLAIIGSRIHGSRSPLVHAQPFDRIDLPDDAPVAALLDALRPWYRGFAVTSPFKRHVADATVNTLRRTTTGWTSTNTDLAGARAVLARFPATIVLGHGGATDALTSLASLTIVRHADAAHAFHGRLIWTWPPHISPPDGLQLTDCEVGVIAYGTAARTVAARIRACGGHPRFFGWRWFRAQARAQDVFWKTTS